MPRPLRRHLHRLAILAVLTFAATSEAQAPAGAGADANEIGPVAALPQGIATGDVGATSAVVWTRLPSGKGLLEVMPEGGKSRRIELRATAKDDFVVQERLEDLAPGTAHRYRVDALDAAGKVAASLEGGFRTAPAAGQTRPIGFVFSGDLGGQSYCRHPEKGYAIFDAMAALHPDFFLANGDMIYADNTCPPTNPDGQPNLVGDFKDVSAPTVDWSVDGAAWHEIAGHWRYNRADGAHQRFLAEVPLFAQWDDHEVVNDFGGAWSEWPIDPGRAGYPKLVAAGLRAFFLYNPIARHADEPNRIYRSFRWGRDLDFWILDARSYRSANDLSDRPANAKVLLGKTQMDWLTGEVGASQATWKVISNDVPLSVPTGSNTHLFGRDAYANGTLPDFSQLTGFESEMLHLLRFLDQQNVENVVFVTTDVHFAMVLRYAFDFDGDDDLLSFHELIAGPLSAYRTPTPAQLDPTLRPTLLFGKGGFDNFLHVRIEPQADGGSLLKAEIRDAQGVTQDGSELELKAKPKPSRP